MDITVGAAGDYGASGFQIDPAKLGARRILATVGTASMRSSGGVQRAMVGRFDGQPISGVVGLRFNESGGASASLGNVVAGTDFVAGDIIRAAFLVV